MESMSIVTPGIGLIFWTTVVFLVLVFLLAKFAWKPILNMVKEREASIDEALKAAMRAREDIKNLQSTNEQMLKEAREERERILKEAREMKDKMISDAKGAASAEADKIVTSAREQINAEKMAAITELKNQVGKLSIEMAERVLRAELKDREAQTALVDRMMEDVKVN